MIFYDKTMFIEIRLCNLTYVFKGHVKFTKIYMMKFDVSVLNKLKIMFFEIHKHNVIFDKTAQNVSLF